MLGYKESFFPEEFISSYIDNSEDNKLILCFDNSDNEQFKWTISKLQEHSSFNTIDYDDDNSEVVLLFDIPKERQVDVNLFKIGRYSKLSNEYKELLLEYHGRKTGAGKCIMMIDSLYPDHLAKKYRADKMSALFIGSTPVSINDLPNGEVMSIIDPEREYYIKTSELNKNKIKEDCGER